MKTNYKIGDEIKVVNTSHFAFGYVGNVLVNNTETNLKPINAILKDGLGSWQFSYADIQPTKDNASQPAKTSDTPKPEIVKDVIEILQKVGFEQVKEKRKYRKKDKTEVKVTKIKRAYNKRK